MYIYIYIYGYLHMCRYTYIHIEPHSRSVAKDSPKLGGAL